MSEFKVGDRVRVVGAHPVHRLKGGEILTIDSLNQSMVELIKGDPMDNLKQGDVLVDAHGRDRKVLVALDQGVKVYLISHQSGAETAGYWYTVQDIKDKGWTLKDSTDTVEITIEEIAQLKGLKPEQVRIKDKE